MWWNELLKAIVCIMIEEGKNEQRSTSCTTIELRYFEWFWELLSGTGVTGQEHVFNIQISE